MIGLLGHALIEKTMRPVHAQNTSCKSVEERNLDIKRLELNEQMLKVSPRVYQIEGKELIYLPEISFKGDLLDIDYVFYAYQGGKLIKVPINF